ncbi:MAG: hypothetical protein U1F43_12535 [Myxococcota bacterium]
MIEVSGLTKSYDDFQASKGIDQGEPRKEIVGFLGPTARARRRP